MITSGYVYGPSGSPAAQAVQFDPSSGQLEPAGVRLLTAYYPIGTPFTRSSWPNGVLPYSAPAGQCITVPQAEATALITAGFAVPV